MSHIPDSEGTSPPANRASAIVATATVLALLYFGRDVLVPITLALLLSLLISPSLRLLRRLGLGHGPSVFVAVCLLALFLTGLTAVVGAQLAHMARNLPQYEATIQLKVHALRAASIGRLQNMQGPAGNLVTQLLGSSSTADPNGVVVPGIASSGGGAVDAPLHAPGSAMAAARHIFSKVWVPLQTAGIVLVVLIFVLLEHEALRDRFIRLAGGTDLRATTAAINDAGERLSRFFVSQFAVNFGVGLVIWLGLTIIGVPNAPLWGILTAVLRFVPYVGVWLAAICAALLAAAVVPGWSMLLATLALYGVVETIVGQVLEPQLYGHTTGLSPLAVVVAAIFWSWLWGPVGLILSTPLSLCLVVAGRHVKALNLLDILLGDLPALTMPQRLYQRALSGDSDEIIDDARKFLKRKSFAAYCDAVLRPALQLARLDLDRGVISAAQQVVVRTAIVRVIETLGSKARGRSSWRRRATLLDDSSLGRVLRQRRESVSGRWQGPVKVAPRSVVLCVSLGDYGDDLSTELLVRILRDLNIDARHLSRGDFETFEAERPAEASSDGVSMIYLVRNATSHGLQDEQSAALEMRRRIPTAYLIAMVLPQLLGIPELAPDDNEVDQIVHSFEEAAQQAMERFPNVPRDAP